MCSVLARLAGVVEARGCAGVIGAVDHLVPSVCRLGARGLSPSSALQHRMLTTDGLVLVLGELNATQRVISSRRTLGKVPGHSLAGTRLRGSS